MFNNYKYLIGMHKRSFNLYKMSAGSTNSSTSRFEPGLYAGPYACEGVFEAIPEKDLKVLPEGEFTHSDIKLTTCPEFLNGQSIDIKDKIVYNNLNYYVHKIKNDVFYGNFIICYLKEQT